MAAFNYRLEKKDTIFIFIILILALSVRLFYLWDYRKTEVYPVFAYSDAYAYNNWAKDISSGDWVGTKAFMKWPFYAYFLGLLFKLTRNNIPVAYLLQFILGAANCILVYFIARNIFHRSVAVIAGLLCVFYAPFVFYDGLLIYSSLSLFFNSLFFLVILSLQDYINGKKLFWAGILLGICAVTQANILIFGILAIMWMIWKNKRSLVYFAAGLFIVIGAVTLRNYLVEKDFVLLTGNAGVNFYLGNNPQASGAFSCPVELAASQEGMFRDAKVIAASVLNRELKTSEVSRFWFNKAIAFIRARPVDFLRLIFRKLIYFFSPREMVHEAEYSYLLGKISVFKLMFADLSFILPLGLLGAVLSFNKLKKIWPLYLIIFALLLNEMMFFVATRYRIAAVPFLAIFSSCGIWGLVRAFKEKRYPEFIGLFLAAVILFVFMNGDLCGKRKKTEGSFPKQLLGHYGVLSLGVADYQENNFAQAEEKFKKALSVFPLSVDAYYNLGLLYNEEGRFTEAQAVLEKAVHLDPDDIGVHFELGKTYKAQGNSVAARHNLNFALAKINRWRVKEIEQIKKELADIGNER